MLGICATRNGNVPWTRSLRWLSERTHPQGLRTATTSGFRAKALEEVGNMPQAKFDELFDRCYVVPWRKRYPTDEAFKARCREEEEKWGATKEAKEWQDSPERARADADLPGFSYTADVFRQFFTTPFEDYKEHIGKRFTVLGPDRESEKNLEYAEEMYKIRFDDGIEITAWGHEVCVLNYRHCKK